MATVKMRLIANAIRADTLSDQALDALIEFILLAAFTKNLILIDPNRRTRASTRGFEDVCVKIRANHLIQTRFVIKDFDAPAFAMLTKISPFTFAN